MALVKVKQQDTGKLVVNIPSSNHPPIHLHRPVHRPRPELVATAEPALIAVPVLIPRPLTPTLLTRNFPPWFVQPVGRWRGGWESDRSHVEYDHINLRRSLGRQKYQGFRSLRSGLLMAEGPPGNSVRKKSSTTRSAVFLAYEENPSPVTRSKDDDECGTTISEQNSHVENNDPEEEPDYSEYDPEEEPSESEPEEDYTHTAPPVAHLRRMDTNSIYGMHDMRDYDAYASTLPGPYPVSSDEFVTSGSVVPIVEPTRRSLHHLRPDYKKKELELAEKKDKVQFAFLVTFFMLIISTMCAACAVVSILGQ